MLHTFADTLLQKLAVYVYLHSPNNRNTVYNDKILIWFEVLKIKKKYLSMRDIAKIADVSVATVSRVINSPEKASPDTVEKVNRIIQEHNYVPNIVARDVFNGLGYKSIAIFVLDLDCAYFVELIRHLNRIAFENKHALLVCNTENSLEREKEYLKYCQSIRTQGIIFTEGYHSSLLLDDMPRQRMVFNDRYTDSDHYSVISDNHKGVRMLVEYLYNLNHRNFAFIGDNPYAKSVEARKSAFIETLESKGISVPEENFFPGSWTTKCGVDAFDFICTLSNKPTAIVCANDAIARGFISRAKKTGLSVPEDFSVVGFDGYSPEYFYPKLTTVRQDVELIARHLFDCVVDPSETPKHLIVDVQMVIGDSCRKIT